MAATPRSELRRARSGSATALRAKPARFGRSRLPRSKSGNGVGRCRLTTRIISSGVTPLATIAATNEPGARADVDVEVVDRAVDRQQVERAQRADLVDAAGEAAAAEHERGLRALRPPRRLAARPVLGLRLELDDLAHRRGSLRRRPALAGRPARRRTFDRLMLLSTGRCAAVIATLLALARRCAGAGPAARPTTRPTCAARSRARCARASRGVGRLRPRPGLRRGALRAARRARRASRPRSRSSTRPRPRCCASGPTATLDTRAVTRRGASTPTASLRGDLVLVGGGDPFFGDASAAQLARAVKAAGVRASTGAVVGDESGFDRRRSGCCAGYDPDLGGVLSALAYDRGFFRGRARLDAARFAAARFAAQLRAAGVRSAGKPRGRARRPPRAGDDREPGVDARRASSSASSTSRRTTSPPRCCSRRSARATATAARRAPAPPSCARRSPTLGGAAADRRRLGPVALQPHDARARSCGCSSAWTTRTSRRRSARRWRSPAAPGPSRRRMRRTAAAERCRVKTGTLRDVSALAGYCRTRRRPRRRLRADVQPRATRAIAKPREDRITAAIARLDDAPAADPRSRRRAAAPARPERSAPSAARPGSRAAAPAARPRRAPARPAARPSRASSPASRRRRRSRSSSRRST